MVNISLTYVQAGAIVFLGIIAYLIGSQSVKVLLKIIFSSKPVMAWNMRRQVEQRKLQQKTQKEVAYDAFSTMAKFVEQLDKEFANNHGRKQFFRDFCDNREIRATVIANYMKRFEPAQEVPVAPAVIKTEKDGTPKA